MFAGLVVALSLAALTLALCRALATLFALPESFGPPPSQHLTLFMYRAGTLIARTLRGGSPLTRLSSQGQITKGWLMSAGRFRSWPKASDRRVDSKHAHIWAT